MRKSFALAVLMLLSVGAVTAPPPETKILVVSQTVGDGLVSNVAAREGRALPTRNAMDMNVDGRPAPNAAAVIQLPARAFGPALTNAQLLASAKAYFQVSVPLLSNSMEAYLQANGLSIGVFNYSQTVQVRGLATPQQLIWSMVKYAGERPMFGDPRLVGAVQSGLQIVYTPQSLEAGLPPDLNYSDPGTLKWRRLNSSGTPISDWTIVEVGGAFDEPAAGEEETDPDFGLKCLLNRLHSPSCAAGVTNAQDLMEQLGYTEAVVDYRRGIAPVYDDVKGADGTTERVARAAVEVSSREFIQRDCRLTAGFGEYRNVGSFGFLLETQTDRYQANVTGTYFLADHFSSSSVSPTRPFDVSQELTKLTKLVDLKDKVVDVSNPPGPLLDASTIPGLTTLPPVTVVSSAQPTLVIADAFYGTRGRCGRAVHVRAACDGQGKIALTVGVTSAVPACVRDSTSFDEQWTYKLTPGKFAFTFPVQSKALGEIAFAFNGRDVTFQMSAPSPRPGALAPYGEILFAPKLGYFVQENFPTGGAAGFKLFYRDCPPGQYVFASKSGNVCAVPDAAGAKLCTPITAAEPFPYCGRYRVIGPATGGFLQ